MRIIVDADACSVKDIIVEVSRLENIKVIMVSNTSVILDYEDIEHIIVDKGKDEADMKILNIIKSDDILVTNDYGLASLALTKCQNIISLFPKFLK